MPEPETAAVRAELARHDEWLSASITVTEVLRATRRWLDVAKAVDADRQARTGDAESLMRRIGLMDVDLAMVGAAGRTDPPIMRTLDAIHLAAAMQIADDIEMVITYDTRLAAAAKAGGLTVASPA